MTAARHARPPAASLEVNEARIWATNLGADWWNLWRARMESTGRITVITASIGGDRVRVACDSKEDATWLRDHMISEGIHKSSVKVVTASRPAATHPLLAVAVAVLVAAALAVQAGLGGNVAPAARWHYPCVMHRAWGFEWFTGPFWEGECLQ